MRQLLYFALIASAFAVEPQVQHVTIEPFVFEDLINKTIESLRPNIPDPLHIDNLPINLPTEGLLTGNASVSNFELTGLKGFQLPFLKLVLVGMKLNFTFVLPSININTNYVANVLVADLVPLYGEGPANVHIQDIQIQGSAQADLSHGIAVKNLVVSISLGSAVFDIHGALNNEEFSLIVSEVLNDMVAPFINNHQEFITNLISPIAEALINAILNHKDPTSTAAPTTVSEY